VVNSHLARVDAKLLGADPPALDADSPLVLATASPPVAS